MPNPQHYTTARDIATLSRALIRNFPEYYKIFGEREFTFHEIKQQNRNGLLFRDPSVDGIKTGHTSAAGYCLATSAIRNGMRLITVVMGAPSIRAREDANAALLSYGYTFYESAKVKSRNDVLAKARVYRGATPVAEVGIARDLIITVPRGDAAGLQTATKLQDPLLAPLPAGKRVGELTLTSAGRVIAREPLVVLKAIPEGGLWTRMVDSVSLWFH
jgi:D-alanyl-D-alanine carboxypeptidase (penicillin-binding protein 5/6)